jgi:hypothetical protein
MDAGDQSGGLGVHAPRRSHRALAAVGDVVVLRTVRGDGVVPV